MNDIRYEVISNSKENFIQLEQLRYNAYQFNTSEVDFENTYYKNDIKSGNYLVFGAYCDNELASACYVSNSHGMLFVEELFTSKKYQSTGLYLGKNLLAYILENKQIVESYFQKSFSSSALYDRYDGIRPFYQQLGFKSINDFMMKKRI